MGIQGLLPFLKHDEENLSAIKASHLTEFKGKKAAIDAYSWLHKAVFTCAHDLYLKKHTTKYVTYCMKNIKFLQQHHITPILVFDGGRMPFKVVETKRREDRQNAKKKADDLIAAGRMNDAFMLMVQSINITHEMASNLMKEARKIGVESVVAPYEADAQLVYLEREGLVDFIISEDSDLIAFGANKIFFKMTATGHGELFDRDLLELCLQAKKRLTGSFVSYKLLYSAILSGCDYLKSLPGIGLIKAWKFMHMTKNDNPRQFLKKIPSYLKMSVAPDDEYIEGFINAVFAFQYQVVFDTRLKQRVTLNTPGDEVDKGDYNKFVNYFKAVDLDHVQLALGNIDHKNRHFDNYFPHTTSHLYFGNDNKAHETENQKTPKSPKCRKRLSEVSPIRDAQEEIENCDEIVQLYKNITPRAPESKKDEKEDLGPQRKRIKCTFLKHKLHVNAYEQSRFFKCKSEQHSATIVEERYDIPKENLSSSVKGVIVKENTEKVGETCDIKIEFGAANKSDDNLRQVFQDVGIDIHSDTSNESQSNLTSNDIPKATTPVKGQEATILHTPESPVIVSNVQATLSKLKEIQNVQKWAKVKKKVLPKNQTTLLGFFTKL